MRVLVYGAGPLGTLLAAQLQQAGHQVSLLARGQRLADLREHGLVLVDARTGEQQVARVLLVESLEPQDAFDLVLVVMSKNRVRDILPALAANRCTPNVLFLQNNAAGPAELAEALGPERVLTGFPMAAGYRRDPVVYYMVSGRQGRKARIPFGEIDGRVTPRTEAVAEILASMPAFDVEIRTDIDAWLKTHVALLMPSLAPAMRAAGRDPLRLARTRDLVTLAVRSIREGFQALRALGIPVTPSSLRRFEWIPEPALVWLLQRQLQHPDMRIAFEHGAAAQDEVEHLAGEFQELVRRSGIPTPSINRLSAYFGPEFPLVSDGSAQIPLDWRGVWIGLGGLAAVLTLAGVGIKKMLKR